MDTVTLDLLRQLDEVETSASRFFNPSGWQTFRHHCQTSGNGYSLATRILTSQLQIGGMSLTIEQLEAMYSSGDASGERQVTEWVKRAQERRNLLVRWNDLMRKLGGDHNVANRRQEQRRAMQPQPQ